MINNVLVGRSMTQRCLNASNSKFNLRPVIWRDGASQVQVSAAILGGPSNVEDVSEQNGVKDAFWAPTWNKD